MLLLDVQLLLDPVQIVQVLLLLLEVQLLGGAVLGRLGPPLSGGAPSDWAEEILVLGADRAGVVQLQVDGVARLDREVGVLGPTLLLAHLGTAVLAVLDQRWLVDVDVILAYLMSLRADVGHGSVLRLRGASASSILLRALVLLAALVPPPLEEGLARVIAPNVMGPLPVTDRVVILLQHMAVGDGRAPLFLAELGHWLAVLLARGQRAWVLQGGHQLVAEVLRPSGAIDREELLDVAAPGDILGSLNVVREEAVPETETKAVGWDILWGEYSASWTDRARDSYSLVLGPLALWLEVALGPEP